MGRIGDIETKSLSARVPMETYIHFLATASKNKQTISSYLCDVLINVSANRKPQSFENGGVTREQLVNANNQAFKGADRLRGIIKNQELQLNKQSETISKLRKKIDELEVNFETHEEVYKQDIEDLQSQINIEKNVKEISQVLVLKMEDGDPVYQKKYVCEWNKNLIKKLNWTDVSMELNKFLALNNYCVVTDEKKYR